MSTNTVIYERNKHTIKKGVTEHKIYYPLLHDGDFNPS